MSTWLDFSLHLLDSFSFMLISSGKLFVRVGKMDTNSSSKFLCHLLNNFIRKTKVSWLSLIVLSFITFPSPKHGECAEWPGQIWVPTYPSRVSESVCVWAGIKIGSCMLKNGEQGSDPIKPYELTMGAGMIFSFPINNNKITC